MVMDVAEQSFFAGCSDGSIYQVELFRWVRTSIFSVSKPVLGQIYLLDVGYFFGPKKKHRFSCCCQVSGTTCVQHNRKLQASLVFMSDAILVVQAYLLAKESLFSHDRKRLHVGLVRNS